jgi:hypothetical protein
MNRNKKNQFCGIGGASLRFNGNAGMGSDEESRFG